MNLFSPEPQFKPGTIGFDSKDEHGQPYDLLGRKAMGERLSELLERINQPLVVALDGGWGSGKSHFLKLWAGAHTLENKGEANVIYFDAFEQDYLDDPLISLVGAIVKTAPTGTKAQEALKTVKKTAMKLARPAARVGLGLLTGGITEVTGPVVDEGIKAAGKSAEKSIDDFWKKEAGRTAAMSEFRAGLQALTEAAKDGTPQKLIFIIDELDRCRPDYALTLLEIIKHFFAVPNVHFVLGTNLTALENSVRARYGAGIDATQHLQKFVHLRVRFPKDTSEQGNGTAAFSYLEKRIKRYSLPNRYGERLQDIVKRIPIEADISLRDVERLLTYAALVPHSIGQIGVGYSYLICGALILRVINPRLFDKFQRQSVSLTEIEEALFLNPMPTNCSTPRKYGEWATWALALEGIDRVKSQTQDTGFLGLLSNVFSDWEEPFNWRDAELHFTTAFDTYTLPNQP